MADGAAVEGAGDGVSTMSQPLFKPDVGLVKKTVILVVVDPEYDIVEVAVLETCRRDADEGGVAVIATAGLVPEAGTVMDVVSVPPK